MDVIRGIRSDVADDEVRRCVRALADNCQDSGSDDWESPGRQGGLRTAFRVVDEVFRFLLFDGLNENRLDPREPLVDSQSPYDETVVRDGRIPAGQVPLLRRREFHRAIAEAGRFDWHDQQRMVQQLTFRGDSGRDNLARARLAYAIHQIHLGPSDRDQTRRIQRGRLAVFLDQKGTGVHVLPKEGRAPKKDACGQPISEEDRQWQTPSDLDRYVRRFVKSWSGNEGKKKDESDLAWEAEIKELSEAVPKLKFSINWPSLLLHWPSPLVFYQLDDAIDAHRLEPGNKCAAQLLEEPLPEWLEDGEAIGIPRPKVR